MQGPKHSMVFPAVSVSAACLPPPLDTLTGWGLSLMFFFFFFGVTELYVTLMGSPDLKLFALSGSGYD